MTEPEKPVVPPAQSGETESLLQKLARLAKARKAEMDMILGQRYESSDLFPESETDQFDRIMGDEEAWRK
jgi:hypothetical protein